MFFQKQQSKTEKTIQHYRWLEIAINLFLQESVFLSFIMLAACYLIRDGSVTYRTAIVMISSIMTAIAFFVRRVNKRLSLIMLILLHSICLVLAVALGKSVPEKIVLTGSLLLISIFSIQKSLNATELNDHEYMSWQWGFLSVCCYIVAMRVHNKAFIILELILFVLFVLLQFAHNYIRKLNHIFSEFEGDETLPIDQMVTVNGTMIAKVFFVILAVLCVFYSGPYGNLSLLIWKGFISFLQLIFGWLRPGDATGDYMATMVTEMTTEEESTDIDETTTHALVEHINQGISTESILFILISVIVIVLLCLLLYLIRNVIHKRRIGKGTCYDEYESCYQEETKTKSKWIYQEDGNQYDANEHLRAVYKKGVNQGAKEKQTRPLSSEMPEELTSYIIKDEQNSHDMKTTNMTKKARENKVNSKPDQGQDQNQDRNQNRNQNQDQDQDQERDQITALYEKARYSNKRITEEDVQKVKNHISKNLH